MSDAHERLERALLSLIDYVDDPEGEAEVERFPALRECLRSLRR